MAETCISSTQYQGQPRNFSTWPEPRRWWLPDLDVPRPRIAISCPGDLRLLANIVVRHWPVITSSFETIPMACIINFWEKMDSSIRYEWSKIQCNSTFEWISNRGKSGLELNPMTWQYNQPNLVNAEKNTRVGRLICAEGCVSTLNKRNTIQHTIAIPDQPWFYITQRTCFLFSVM